MKTFNRNFLFIELKLDLKFAKRDTNNVTEKIQLMEILQELLIKLIEILLSISSNYIYIE